jgi:hypothetical protein
MDGASPSIPTSAECNGGRAHQEQADRAIAYSGGVPFRRQAMKARGIQDRVGSMRGLVEQNCEAKAAE